MSPTRIMIVDDDQRTRGPAWSLISDEGFAVDLAQSCAAPDRGSRDELRMER